MDFCHLNQTRCFLINFLMSAKLIYTEVFCTKTSWSSSDACLTSQREVLGSLGYFSKSRTVLFILPREYTRVRTFIR